MVIFVFKKTYFKLYLNPATPVINNLTFYDNQVPIFNLKANE